MMTNLKALIISLFTLLLPLCIKAQIGTLFNYTKNLSSSFVQQVYQDRQGFIWVSTANGLNRYDGYTFQTYTADNGLPIDNITCVIQDKNNLIYVGTSSGLYVKLKDKFVCVTNKDTGEELSAYINCFCFSPDGNIVFSTSGRKISLMALTSLSMSRIFCLTIRVCYGHLPTNTVLSRTDLLAAMQTRNTFLRINSLRARTLLTRQYV